MVVMFPIGSPLILRGYDAFRDVQSNLNYSPTVSIELPAIFLVARARQLRRRLSHAPGPLSRPELRVDTNRTFVLFGAATASERQIESLLCIYISDLCTCSQGGFIDVFVGEINRGHINELQRASTSGKHLTE